MPRTLRFALHARCHHGSKWGNGITIEIQVCMLRRHLQRTPRSPRREPLSRSSRCLRVEVSMVSTCRRRSASLRRRVAVPRHVRLALLGAWPLSSSALAPLCCSPAGQFSQLELPSTSLYLPSGHSLHSAPSRPVYPATHLQAVLLLLPATLVELAGQASQP